MTFYYTANGRALSAFAILVCASIAVSRADAAPAAAKDPWQQIVFYVAKGEPDECGRDCREWIAADGLIDRDAPRRLRDLLTRLGNRRLPVYFHSPGGVVDAGLAIGRMLRERGMTAGVARTIPIGCDPTRERDAACEEVKRAGRELVAELRISRTLCNSSCVYALIGAAMREVGAGARIGVHEIALGQYDATGMPVARDRKELSRDELNHLRAAEVRLARYIDEMGIDKGLFDAASAIGHERVRYLSLDEIARFGIDRREFHESRWMLEEGPPRPPDVVKFLVEARGSGPKQFRTTLIRLSCVRTGDLRVRYSRELVASDQSVAMAVTSTDDAFVLAAPKAKPIVGYNDVVIEDRLARAPLTFFEQAAKGDAIEIIQALAPPAEKIVTRISTQGLAGAMRTLRQQCRT